MQQLLNICHNYAINHQLLYNNAKSFPLCFKDNTIKIKQPSFFLNDLKLLFRAFTTHPVVCIQTFGPGGIIYCTYTELINSIQTLISMSSGFILFLYNLFICDVDIIYTFISLIVFTQCLYLKLLVILYGP